MKPVPFARAVTTSARRAQCIVLSLILSGACAETDSAGDSQLEGVESPLHAPSCEAEPEYSQEDLEQLAQSPAVSGMNMPFAASPQPDESLHVAMSDGVRLAVSLYFPATLDRRSSKAPAVFVDSMYGRAMESVAVAIDLYRSAGFVVVIADSRGFGASFGSQPGLMGSVQRRDQSELAHWISTRPWSNGKIAAVGLSLSATLLDIMTGSGAPALQAAILRNGDFDAYGLNMLPGGVPNLNMQGRISGFFGMMSDQSCVADVAACAQFPVAPVQSDHDLSLLQAAFADHATNLGSQALGQIVYRDDLLGTGAVGDMSPSEQLGRIRRARVPARISAGWLDGVTAQGALERFTRAPEVPMELFISAANHQGGVDGDPFESEPFGPARPGALTQYAADVQFAMRALSGAQIGRIVNYYVLGADRWKSSAVWPPAGVERQTLRFSRHGLSVGVAKRGERSYAVDPTTSAGARFSRWSSQYGEPVYYGDRRALSGRRLSFDAPRVKADTELVGAPELCLALRSDQPDGLVVAYLEDVAPDGRVTYLTEGQLRLLHRKTASGGCDPAPGTERSFNRADGAPVTPGELMQVELPLWPTAALLRKHHHLRVSLAGADDGTFPLLSATPAHWSVVYGGTDGSTVIVPTKPWSANEHE